MQRVVRDIIINKQPHQIYFFISNPENLPFWSEFAMVEKVSGDGGIGSTYNIITSSLLGKKKTPIEITRKIAHQHFAFKNNSTSYANETGFKLEEIDGTTKVTAYQEVEIGSLVSLITLNFISLRDTANILSKMLEKLKITLETS